MTRGSSSLGALLLLLPLACAQPQQAADAEQGGTELGNLPDGARIIDNVTVVDANGLQASRAVVIADGTIDDIRAAGQSWPSSAEVIDGAGGYLIPGLVDAHVHLLLSGTSAWVGDPLESNLRAALYHGVTTVVDVGATRAIFALREGIASGRVLGPRLLASGPFLTAVGSHPCETYPWEQCEFVDATSAGANAGTLIAAGATVLKVALADAAFTPWPTPRLDLEALAQITAQAAQHSLPVVAHIDTSADLVDAVDSGVSLIAHPPFDAPASTAATQAATQAAAVHSTIGAFSALVELVDGATDLADSELLLADGVLDSWAAIQADPSLVDPTWLAQTRQWAEMAEQNLVSLRAAGAFVLPTSDAGYMYVPHGIGLRFELQRLADLGWPPLQLLAAVTRDARQLHGLPGGLVEIGAPADLVLLRDNPVASVEALATIDTVVLGGLPFDRQELRTLDLLEGKQAAGELCLDAADCADGLTCDGLAHLCAQTCTTPYAAINDCGPGAWCMPADAVATTAEGVCHTEPHSCDPYFAGADCGPPLYALTCQPLDLDTSGCRAAGSAVAGESCSYTDSGSTCGPGLYCSIVDATCYQLCDPTNGAPATCPPEQSCVEQPASSDTGWFGLCL